MGGSWTGLRNAVEDAAVIAGNYFLPGSSMLTSQLASKGSQKDLSSTLGQVAQIGSGVSGGMMGTGSNWGNLSTGNMQNMTSGVSGFDSAAGIGGNITGGVEAGVSPDVALGGGTGGGSAASVTGAGSGTADPALASGGSAATSVSPSQPTVAPVADVSGAAPSVAPATAGTPPATSQYSLGSSPVNSGLTSGTSTSGLQPTGLSGGAITPSATGTGLTTPAATTSSMPAWLQSAGSNILAGAEKNAVPLGLAALSLSQKQPAPQTQPLNNLSAPLAATSAQLIANFNSGQLTAADSQNISQWKQQQQASVKQYYAQAGLGDSSMAQQAMAQIDAQAVQMTQQALNNYLQQGSSVAGVAAGPMTSAVTGQIAQNTQAMQQQQAFMTALAKMTSGA